MYIFLSTPDRRRGQVHYFNDKTIISNGMCGSALAESNRLVAFAVPAAQTFPSDDGAVVRACAPVY